MDEDHIKTSQDIDLLRRAKAVSATLLDHIEDYFLQLKNQQEVKLRLEGYLDK